MLLPLLGAGMARAEIDHQLTREVWRLKYKVTPAQWNNPAWLTGDDDKDGSSNADELAVGTNPFNPASIIELTRVQRNGNLMEVHFNTEPGKRYRLETNTVPGNTGWTLAAAASPAQIAGDGSAKILTIPWPQSRLFCRVRVDELDTDNDRLSDWVEAAVSLNPGLVQSVPNVNDYDYVASQVALPDTVVMRAPAPFASEDGPQAGQLTVVREQKLFPLTVSYAVTGTAVPGVDYTDLPGTLVLGAGIGEAAISVNPVPHSSVKGGRSVTAALTAAAGYTAGFPDKATVIIQDSTAPTGTGLLARYYDTGTSLYADAANFGQAGTYTFTRSTPTTSGSAVISYTNLGAQSLSALQPGHQVRLSFTSGSLNNALYNHLDYPVTAVGPTSFTIGMSAASAFGFTSTSGSCSFSIRSFPHPAVLERVDSTVNFDWVGGTPNGVTITPANSPDNYSSAWEAWLHPTTAGSYTFQLDADDKGRVLLDTGSGLVQILEHGWDTPATIGTYKASSAITLAVPATAAQRYKIRVEQVETTGDARTRLQWRLGSGGFANIPQANVFTATTPIAYTYTRSGTVAPFTGSVVVTPTGGHSLVVGNQVQLDFSSGNLFTPANGNFHGTYTVSAVGTNADTTPNFTVALTPGTLPASGTGSGFLGNPDSATTGWLNRIYANTSFSGVPGRVGVDTGLNAIYGIGTPLADVINPDSFSVRWTGQVQPQFTEEYTFVTNVDDNVSLRINGQVQTLRVGTTNTVGGTYAYNASNAVLTVTHSSIPAGSFVVGEMVRLDPTSGPVTALVMTDYPIQSVSGNTFTVQLPASAAATGTGNVNLEVPNKPLTDFAFLTSERYVRIPMVGGVRYDLQLDYFEGSQSARCQLFWFSPSQPRQIIPQERLYPSTVPQAPGAVLAETSATALVGGPFSHTIKGSNGSTITASGLPSWLSLSGGVLSGTPPTGAGGDYQIILTSTGPSGTSTSLVNLHVEDTGSSVVREYWTGLPGNDPATIPLTTAPAGSANLSQLQAPTDFGDDYGARIRGYLTAPVTGNYYFWLAASGRAELWISNDAEPVNAFKRAWVDTGSNVPLTWNTAPEQKTPWLALEQGKRYYFEILHKTGTGAGDNLAVGWDLPGGTGLAPSGVVPGYVLSPYVAPSAAATPGTLYVSTMLSQNGAVTNGVGNSTLRLSADEQSAIMTYSYNGLTGPITSQHIHTDPWLTHASTIVFDIDTPVTPGDGLQPVGTYKWTILPVGTLSRENIVEIIKQGKAYINLHTALYPAGEIRGNYTAANGSRTFTPPPAPPSWTDDHTTNSGASRFLTQATFGPNAADIAALKAMPSYSAWIDDQFTKPATPHLPDVLQREIADAFGPFDTKLSFNTWWKQAVTAPDQLRQRVAFALSQIHVVSGDGPLEDNSRAISHFYDTLLTNAFGNFRDLLEATTLTPGMGRYLDMLRNDKPDLSVGRIPNENYAREIKQLFSIGLYRMWPDGTLMLNSKDSPIDTYNQREIVGFAHVFTGWDYGYDGALRTTLGATTDWTRPMREVPGRHFTGPKRVLNNEVLPGLPTLGGQSLDPYGVHHSTYFNQPAYQVLPGNELDAAHDQLFNHPNTAPFLCRQLIQRLVTSHPSRDYLYRVVQKFNDNGSSVRGDMKAVIKAILLDYEARSTTEAAQPTFGKQREPIMRIAAAARAFRPEPLTGSYAQNDSNIITITTSAPHKLAAGNTVFLNFTDTTGTQPAPTTGSYTVLTTPAPTSNTYAISAPGWITGTYNQPAGSSVMTVSITNHWLPAGGSAWFDFTSGTANGLASFDRTVRTVVTSNSFDTPSGVGNVAGSTFTLTAPDTTARSGNVMISRFGGSYSSGGGAITIDTAFGGAGTYGNMADHHLSVTNNVFLNFTNSRDTTSGSPSSTANDLIYPIASVPDANTFTVTSSAAVNSDNQVFVFPQIPQPMIRSGNITTALSTFNMENTDADLEQTPLNSPTVFNFFLPDYKFAGALASQGMTTPEFQLTAETTVVRQSNFIYNGIFNPSFNTSGLMSFKSGSNALVMDVSAWMGNAVDTGLGAGPVPAELWTSNANLPTLVDRFNTLLLAGQLPPAARTRILAMLHRPVTAIALGNSCVITAPAHGLVNNNSVTLNGITGGTFSTAINGTFTATVLTTDTFRVTSNCTAIPTSLTSAFCSPIPYNNAAPTATQIRDRLRAVLHLILTSPDFTIQR